MYVPGSGIVAEEAITEMGGPAGSYAAHAAAGSRLGSAPGREAFAKVRAGLRIAAHNAVTTFANMGTTKRATIYDIGCGRGQATPLYTHLGTQHTITGIDNCLEALRAAAERTTAEGTDFTAVHADMNAWDPPPEAADLCVSLFAMHYAKSTPFFAQLMAKLMKPGATAVLTTMHGERVARALRDNGGTWRSPDGYMCIKGPTTREHAGQVRVSVAGALSNTWENLVFERQLNQALRDAGLQAVRLGLPLADIGAKDAGEAGQMYVAHVLRKPQSSRGD